MSRVWTAGPPLPALRPAAESGLPALRGSGLRRLVGLGLRVPDEGRAEAQEGAGRRSGAGLDAEGSQHPAGSENASGPRLNVEVRALGYHYQPGTLKRGGEGRVVGRQIDRQRY